MSAAAQARTDSAAAEARTEPPAPFPATFQDRQIIALLTKWCLATKSAHFARAMRPETVVDSLAAVQGALQVVYATLMQRDADELPPVVLDLMVGAQQDGGLATVSGVPVVSASGAAAGMGDGERCSYVAAATTLETHLLEVTTGIDRSTANGAPHPLQCAADRIRHRQSLLDRGELTVTEVALREAVACVAAKWGVKRDDAPPRPAPPPGAAEAAPACPISFVTLADRRVKRSQLMRGVRNAWINNLRAVANARERATIESLQRQSNNWASVIPATPQQTIADRAIPGLLRAMYGVSHYGRSDGPGLKLHLAGSKTNRVTQYLQIGDTDVLEHEASFATAVRKHDELTATVGNAIIPTALPTAAVFFERSLAAAPSAGGDSLSNGGYDDDDPGGTGDPGGSTDDDDADRSPPTVGAKAYDDIAVVHTDGTVYRLDVTIVNVNCAATTTAAQRSATPVHDRLVAAEQRKLRAPGVQRWLASATGDRSANMRSSADNTPTLLASGASPNIGVSADGSRVFVPFAITSSGLLGASAATFLQGLAKSARHDHTDLIAMQRRPIADEGTWASRNFTAWARQRLSLSTLGLVGICIDDALRRDAIAALPSRGRGVIDHRRPGYAPLRSVVDDAPSGLLHHMRDAAAQAASAP